MVPSPHSRGVIRATRHSQDGVVGHDKLVLSVGDKITGDDADAEQIDLVAGDKGVDLIGRNAGIACRWGIGDCKSSVGRSVARNDPE